MELEAIDRDVVKLSSEIVKAAIKASVLPLICKLDNFL
jgi:hypothetical protein